MKSNNDAALWIISVEASNEGGGGNRILYAVTGDKCEVPDPVEVIDIALPGEVIYQVNSIRLLGLTKAASADVCQDHPLTMLAKSFQEKSV